MSAINAFNQNHLLYDSWFDENRQIYEAENQALRALMPGTPKALEVGVGTGRFAAPLQVAYGIEPSLNMALLARSRGVQVCRALGEWLPFPNGTFHCVILITVLCFIEDKRMLLEECCRVLKTRGDLIVGMIDKDSQLGAVYEASKDEDVFFRHASFLSAKQAFSLLVETGFECLECKQTIIGIPHQSSGWDEVKEGFGEGAFVVIRARKIDDK